MSRVRWRAYLQAEREQKRVFSLGGQGMGHSRAAPIWIARQGLGVEEGRPGGPAAGWAMVSAQQGNWHTRRLMQEEGERAPLNSVDDTASSEADLLHQLQTPS